MDLSIVIVTWNTREMTAECLGSVYSGLGNLRAEVIVVDNGSNDGSAEMVADRFPEAVLLRNTENRGFAAANNQAFAVARGRHLLLLNTDTLVHGTVLRDSVAWLDKHPKAGAMGCRVLNTDGTVQLTCSMYPSILNHLLQASGLWKLTRPSFFGRFLMTGWQRDSEREVEAITGCFLLVRRKVIDEVGVLDEAFFFYGEETDWCRRIRAAGWLLFFVPLGEITHHGSVSARKLDHRRDVLLTEAKVRLHRKHGGFFQAALVWIIAAGFNGSRAVWWSLRGLSGNAEARVRGRHFRMVIRDLRHAWVDR